MSIAIRILAGLALIAFSGEILAAKGQEARPPSEQTLYSEEFPIEHPVLLSSNILKILLATRVAKSGLNFASDSETRDPAKLFEASEIHLGRPDEVDLIVMGIPPMRGADNTWFWVIRSARKNPRIVLFDGCNSLEVTSGRANSLRDIRTVWSDSSDTHTAIYQFDGARYKLRSNKSEPANH